MKTRTVTGVFLAVLAVGAIGWAVAPERPAAERRDAARKAFEAGNFNDAWKTYAALAADPQDDPAVVPNDFELGINCLQRLGRHDEIDDFREKVVAAHSKNWRLLKQAATSLHQGDSYGFVVAGKFYRGGRRGNDGRHVNAIERDRVRSLQLMSAAADLAASDADRAAAGDFYVWFAMMLQDARYGDGAWRLQSLSDLSTLPDYDDGYRYHYGYPQRGAPVDENGQPLFHRVPKSWADAKSDGERWRWCLTQAAEVSPAHAGQARFIFAQFLRQQFDVQTMAQYGFAFQPFEGNEDTVTEVAAPGEGDMTPAQSGPYAVRTLGEDETIAKLASGIKRFTLPEEFNFIHIYQDLAAGNDGYAEQALNALAQLFTDRQQYPRAADYWQQSLQRFGKADWKAQALHQITGNWGRFDPAASSPAGDEASLGFVYRNGKNVSFTAHEIRVGTLLEDVKAYLKGRPAQVEWERLDVQNVGQRLVERNQVKYIGDQVAQWDLALDPRDKHFDRRITVKTPLKKAGAYLVTAKMGDGNETRIVLWVADTVLVRKHVDGGAWYFVADAKTGAPVGKANLEFFGYRQEHLGDNKWRTHTHQFAEFAGADGQLKLSGGDGENRTLRNDHAYLVIATTPQGRLAYTGFSNVWWGRWSNPEFSQTKAFGITDRPVYRPGQSMKFKFWVAQAKYDQPRNQPSPYAGQAFHVVVHNPKSERVFEQQFTADEFGGVSGELALPSDATLGVYTASLTNHGQVFFRVEEYKKPEFEVKVDAPAEAITLGDKITATITARYYFGAPVAEAKVKYKVLRSEANATWYPPSRWDWFYGPGYGWFGCDYAWYPRFGEWGCRAPYPWWYPFPRQQPEVVMENEVSVGPDGTVKVEIDSAVAKAMYGDKDHRYEITAEVTDNSRRTIVGQGAATAARQPFKVYAWVDRGYYQAGDVVRADFAAHTLDRKPIASAKGKLRLMRVSYDDRMKPSEAEVGAWDLGTDSDGRATQQIKAAAPGQYRLSYAVTDGKGRSIEGGYLFVVRGEGFRGEQFRFNDVELVADKKEYRPGEKVRLMINTNRPNSTVALFVRPVNGIYAPPKIVRLDGKSAVEEIDVAAADMPNFFVEAFTVGDSQVFSQTREIIVPPENRVVNVEVLPNKSGYKPGEKAKVKLRLTDDSGEPVVGSAVVSVYDKSVEYISGGSNVPEIKAFFWKWRRSHYPGSELSLKSSLPLKRNNEFAMAHLGVFGHMVGDLSLGAKDRIATRGERDERKMMRSAAREAPAAPGAMADSFAKSGVANEQQRKDEDAPAEVGQPLVEETVRKNFADTALWVASVVTGRDGVAEVALDMPENLTTWKARVWSMSAGTRVGQGEAEVVTTKDLLVRMQAPRFFVQKDRVVLSANVHNYLDVGKRVKVTLELDGPYLTPIESDAGPDAGAPGNPYVHYVDVPAKGEARVDWVVDVAAPGAAVVRMKAQTDVESDAMQMSFPVYIHGMLKTDSYAGAMRRGDRNASLTIRVPAERLPEHSRLEIRYSPSVAAAMVDALPYLVDYPYGCTEQTLNRFIPTVITQRTLIAMGLDLKSIREKRTNLNAQEIGDPAARAARWKQHASREAVFDEAVVAAMVKQGVDKLTNMQLSDGGWGWFSGAGEHSSPHTTAVVVHGLQLARDNDVALVPGVLERGTEWLKTYQATQVTLLRHAPSRTEPYKTRADNLDAFVFMVLTDAGVGDDAMRDFLYRDRVELAAYAKAVYGLALHKLGEREKLAMILENLSQFVVRDDENQTAYLRLPEGNHWWYWYGSDTEANAFYLKLLSRTDAKGELAPRLAKYLINNRRNATYWNSTRDTAYCVEALAEYVGASGEDRPDMTVAVLLNGRKVKEVKIDKTNLFTFDNTFVLAGTDVPAGGHKIEFVKHGTGPLYYNAYVTNFTLEDRITRAGLEVKVDRKFYRLVLDKGATAAARGARGHAVTRRVEKYRREEIKDGDTLTGGDLVEVELEIDSKNDYEYLLFEDMKASGFEPVEVRSGYNGNDLNAYMELRDERVCFFARTLSRGKHSVAYRLRAEIPGKFSALPTRASAMYAPELKANSDETRLNIQDPPPSSATVRGE